jgi:hypothetical protein
VHATKALAFTQNEADAALGKVLVSAADWHVGGPLELLNALNIDLDVISSILPFRAKNNRSMVLTALDGHSINLGHDLGT